MARRGKTVDYKQWISLPGLSDSTSTNELINATAIDFQVPATILRIRGSGGLIMFDETVQAGDEIDIGIGIGIVSTDAFNAGVASLPNPLGDFEYPWLYLAQQDLVCTVAIGDQALGSTTYRFPDVDTRAMRKIKPSQALVYVFESGGAAGAPVTNLKFPTLRVLIGT